MTQTPIINRRKDESILSSSPQQQLLLQLTTFLSSSVPRIWVFLRAGRTVDDRLCGPQIGDKKLKNATDNMTIIAPFLRVLSKDNKFIFKIYFTKRPLNTGPAIAAKRDGIFENFGNHDLPEIASTMEK